jgi:hypothetical protein
MGIRSGTPARYYRAISSPAEIDGPVVVAFDGSYRPDADPPAAAGGFYCYEAHSRTELFADFARFDDRLADDTYAEATMVEALALEAALETLNTVFGYDGAVFIHGDCRWVTDNVTDGTALPAHVYGVLDRFDYVTASYERREGNTTAHELAEQAYQQYPQT